MKRVLSFWSVVILSLCGVLALAEEGLTSPTVKSVRLGVDAKGQTRLVVDLDHEPEYRVSAHTSQPNGTARTSYPVLSLRVERSNFAIPSNKFPKSKGVVKGVSISGNDLIISLEKPALPEKTFILPPSGNVKHYRLVLDLDETTADSFAAASVPFPTHQVALAPAPSAKPNRTADQSPKKSQKNVSKSELPAELLAMKNETPVAIPPTPSLKPQLTVLKQASANGKKVIAIDPGHGGRDPGAIGSTGLQEKHVTLSAAKTLKAILEKRGYIVILTRDKDVYIDLEDRITFARTRRADLFLSIHADANSVPEVRGASVYTLSEDRSQKMAKEVTSSGNFRVFDVEVSSDDSEVSSILFDLANTDTKNQSARLATSLITEMRGVVPMVNNTHRKAGLVVLLSPDVPAVLVELAFLSNKKDEANLGSKKWRKKSVTAVADGIDRYFSSAEAQRTAARASERPNQAR